MSSSALSSASGLLRKAVIVWASIDTGAHLVTILCGAQALSRFPASLEVRLLVAWVLLLAVTIGCFIYYLSGLSESLWKRGIWFNANDVLHLGLAVWLVYLLVAVRGKVADLPMMP